jgi:hypothetical protein
MKKMRPDIQVMLMSGGSVDGSLLVLNYGWAFIKKPFLIKQPLQMVTDVLGSPDRSQLGGEESDSRKDKLRERRLIQHPCSAPWRLYSSRRLSPLSLAF